MDPRQAALQQARRSFLTTFASGVGGLALASLLRDDGVLAAESGVSADAGNPLALRPPHFAPKAKACIFIFLEGAPSQLDLFD
ncbi:MAG TPA: sulfatase, partial [Pirellulales bacterium]